MAGWGEGRIVRNGGTAEGGVGFMQADIARMIREERHAAGLSQVELGRRCGMGQARISGIECGYVNLSVDALERLAKALGKKLVVRFE